MVEKTLKKIEFIEEKAAEIIKQGRQSSTLSLIKTREDHAQELEALKARSKKEGEALVRAAEEEAKRQAAKIETDSQKDIKELIEKARAKIEPAKKEILRCLS